MGRVLYCFSFSTYPSMPKGRKETVILIMYYCVAKLDIITLLSREQIDREFFLRFSLSISSLGKTDCINKVGSVDAVGTSTLG